jgi:outer membrane immunogenic protein
MKLKMIAAIAALMASSTPALASNFTGVRAEVTAGADNVTQGIDTTDVTYGVGVGVDAEVYKNVIVGVEANVDNVFDRRNIGASARLGLVVSDDVMVYGKVGYANWEDVTSKKLDGLRLGAGLEYHVVGPFYVGGEYRYTDFAGKTGQHGGFLKAGMRF